MKTIELSTSNDTRQHGEYTPLENGRHFLAVSATHLALTFLFLRLALIAYRRHLKIQARRAITQYLSVPVFRRERGCNVSCDRAKSPNDGDERRGK